MIKTIPGAEITYYTLFWPSKMRAYIYKAYYIIENALKTCQDTSKSNKNDKHHTWSRNNVLSQKCGHLATRCNWGCYITKIRIKNALK